MSWFYILTILAKATRRNAKIYFFMKECNQLEAYVILFPNTKNKMPICSATIFTGKNWQSQ